jgi:hypothetical protein
VDEGPEGAAPHNWNGGAFESLKRGAIILYSVNLELSLGVDCTYTIGMPLVDEMDSSGVWFLDWYPVFFTGGVNGWVEKEGRVYFGPSRVVETEDHTIAATRTPLALSTDGVEFVGVDEESYVLQAMDVGRVGGYV